MAHEGIRVGSGHTASLHGGKVDPRGKGGTLRRARGVQFARHVNLRNGMGIDSGYPSAGNSSFPVHVGASDLPCFLTHSREIAKSFLQWILVLPFSPPQIRQKVSIFTERKKERFTKYALPLFFYDALECYPSYSRGSLCY